MAVKGKFLKRPSALTIYRQKAGGASTTTTAAAAKGATTIALTSATGVTAASRSSSAPTRTWSASRSRRSRRSPRRSSSRCSRRTSRGDVVVEQSAYAIGGIKGGIKVTHAKETPDEFSGDLQRLVYGTLEGFQTMGVEVTLQGFTIPNLCIALGIPFARIFGAGASISAPASLATD
jgi:hypothetical protein